MLKGYHVCVWARHLPRSDLAVLQPARQLQLTGPKCARKVSCKPAPPSLCPFQELSPGPHSCPFLSPLRQPAWWQWVTAQGSDLPPPSKRSAPGLGGAVRRRCAVWFRARPVPVSSPHGEQDVPCVTHSWLCEPRSLYSTLRALPLSALLAAGLPPSTSSVWTYSPLLQSPGHDSLQSCRTDGAFPAWRGGLPDGYLARFFTPACFCLNVTISSKPTWTTLKFSTCSLLAL